MSQHAGRRRPLFPRLETALAKKRFKSLGKRGGPRYVVAAGAATFLFLSITCASAPRACERGRRWALEGFSRLWTTNGCQARTPGGTRSDRHLPRHPVPHCLVCLHVQYWEPFPLPRTPLVSIRGPSGVAPPAGPGHREARNDTVRTHSNSPVPAPARGPRCCLFTLLPCAPLPPFSPDSGPCILRASWASSTARGDPTASCTNETGGDRRIQ
jgi:hypothetical protein